MVEVRGVVVVPVVPSHVTSACGMCRRNEMSVTNMQAAVDLMHQMHAESDMGVSEAPSHPESFSTRISPRLAIVKLVLGAMGSSAVKLGRWAPSHSITQQR